MAILLPAMIAFGLTIGTLERTSDLKAMLLDWHLATGLALLVLVSIRIGIRVRNRSRIAALRPPESTGRRWAIRVSHYLLYLLMLFLPLLGLGVWLTDPFVGGPALLGRGVAAGNLSEMLHRFHYLGAWLLLVVVPIHVVGAFWPERSGRRAIARMW